MELGEKLKQYLEDNGITQSHISRKTGINPVKLNLALNGNRKFTFSEYELVCGALKAGMLYIDKRIDGGE